jgi:hypothetical protein
MLESCHKLGAFSWQETICLEGMNTKYIQHMIMEQAIVIGILQKLIVRLLISRFGPTITQYTPSDAGKFNLTKFWFSLISASAGTALFAASSSDKI